MNKRRKGKEARRNLRERETRLDKIEKMLKDFLKVWKLERAHLKLGKV